MTTTLFHEFVLFFTVESKFKLSEVSLRVMKAKPGVIPIRHFAVGEVKMRDMFRNFGFFYAEVPQVGVFGDFDLLKFISFLEDKSQLNNLLNKLAPPMNVKSFWLSRAIISGNLVLYLSSLKCF